MPNLILDIALSSDRLLAVYQGRANRILVHSREGQRVSLPAHHLRPFITESGIYGRFAMEYSNDGKLLGLRRV